MGKPFYLTTTLPYVNAPPHVGFALEIVQADIIARYRRLLGDDVFFNTVTDEHGLKIYRKALEEGKDPQVYVDEYAEKFRNLKKVLNLIDDVHFVRTTDPHHKKAAQEFWQRCLEKGDIYKKTYKGLYCVGDELFVTEKDLINGKCPNHPDEEPIEIEEENYFFRFSKYQGPLLELYNTRPDFIVPQSRFNEIKKFVERGLEDFSISRLKEKMPWGVPVPNDEAHVIYVWFDALINYISILGWPEDKETFEKYWPGIQFAGKDQIRQQAAMWQAMLLSAGLPPSKKIIIHGFITSRGQKMSKSLGNVVDPVAIVNEYGTDALRYYLARHVHPFEDSDFTIERFKEAYNANLANGLGNLVARVMRMAEDHLSHPLECGEIEFDTSFSGPLEEFQIQQFADQVWEWIGHIDALIQIEQPFRVIKKDREKGIELINVLVKKLHELAGTLQVIMPETAEKIQTAIKENKMPETLFPRKE